MFFKVIQGHNRVLGPPEGWNPETDGDCGSLHVRVLPYAPGLMSYESAWEPTPDEMEMLRQGGSIILRTIGVQPPVAMYVTPQESADGKS